MQYNKYALALVFMASSAFASFQRPNFGNISVAFLYAVDEDAKKEALNGLEFVNAKKFYDDHGSTYSVVDVQDDLENLYDEYIAKTIHNKLANKDYSEFDNLMDPWKSQMLKEYVENASTLLTEEEIKEFLKKNILPELKAEDKAARIFELCNSDFISEITDFKRLATYQQIKIISLKERISGQKLKVEEITAILKLSEAEIESEISRILDHIFEKINNAISSGKNFNDIDSITVDSFGLDFEQLLALINKNPAKNSAEIKNI